MEQRSFTAKMVEANEYKTERLSRSLCITTHTWED